MAKQDVIQLNCIYCGTDASVAKEKYHVAPHAAGNAPEYRLLLNEVLLPRGLVCDNCNLYFGQKIEPALANHPYVQQWRAVHGIRSRKGRPAYSNKEVGITTREANFLALSGRRIELTRHGHLRVPKPSLERMDHLRVSRAVHKVALEYELREIVKVSGLEGVWKAAQERPLSIVADYVRRGHRTAYRPYGVEFGGATRVTIAPCKFLPDPHGILVSPPAFTGYIVGLPGARFTCTLAEDSSLLRYMLMEIEKLGTAPYMTTRNVFWTPDSSGLSEG